MAKPGDVVELELKDFILTNPHELSVKRLESVLQQ